MMDIGDSDFSDYQNKTVTAYKDLNGTLHLSSGECKRSDEKIIPNRVLNKVSGVFSKILDENIQRDYRHHHNSLSSSYVFMVLTNHWKQIRDELNVIKE